jgi:hypothetical protein
MGELKGPIQFVGSVGNIRVYYNKTLKRYIVSTKGGSKKELIMKNPEYARQRENMTEFGAVAVWASLLRHSLTDILHLTWGYYFSGFMKLGKTIQKHDDLHFRGKRSIESSKDALLLTTLNFNKVHPFEQVLSQRFDTSFSADRKTVTISMPGFSPYSRISWPVRYKFYRFILVIAQLPDLEFKEKEKVFVPVVAGLEELSAVAITEWKANGMEPEDIVISASFAQPALQHMGTTVIVALGIEVSPGLGEVFKGGIVGVGSMKIVECFG